MHIMIHSSLLRFVCVVFFRGKAKIWCEVRIPEKGSNAFNNIAVKNFARFQADLDHVTLKTWASREFFVDDGVQLPRIFER